MIGPLLKYFSNLPGWCTNRKIVVIESDDWGSVRMPSLQTAEILRKSGIPVEKDPYCRFDALESNLDLEALFEVLSTFRDRRGNCPVITALAIMANPDFKRIKASGFSEYFYEPFSETLKRYPERDNVFSLWKTGIGNKLFVPQFHGREHLNVQRWLRDLQSGNAHTRLAFENELWGIYSPLINSEYQAAFDIEFAFDNLYLHSVLAEGLQLFERLLGYKAQFFVPPNGPFNLGLEKTLAEQGIRYVTLDKVQFEPLGDGKHKVHFRYPGMRNRHGQIYLTRNAVFEPSQFPNKDMVDSCLRDIRIAFRMKKPAVISTHRLNYIGWLDPKNRGNSLFKLKILLKRILETWPDVEFMTSVQIGNLIRETSNSITEDRFA